MIRVSLTIDNAPISSSNYKKIKRFGVELEIIHNEELRIIISALIKNKGRMNSLERFLRAKGYNPILICSLGKDGISTGDILFNEAEYIDAMPDIIERDEDGNEISRARPIVFKEVHNFSGWGAINV